MKRLIFLFALLLTAMQLNAQIAVKGTVTASDNGDPMIGASVMEKGTMNGTVTGVDGTYALNVTDGNAVLVFTSIGFKPWKSRWRTERSSTSPLTSTSNSSTKLSSWVIPARHVLKSPLRWPSWELKNSTMW